MGFLKEFFETPEETRERINKELTSKFMQDLRTYAAYNINSINSENQKYQKLFPIGYKVVEQKHASEISPLKDLYISKDVCAMVRAELELLVPPNKIEFYLSECYDHRVSGINKKFDVLEARRIIDSLCTYVKANTFRSSSSPISNYMLFTPPVHIGIEYPKTYDYENKEAPIIKELELRRKEKEKNKQQTEQKEKDVQLLMHNRIKKGNEYYFQFYVTEEQKQLAQKLVEYSILHHPVSDIYANDPNGKIRQREFRYTGSLGEIVFADAYGLRRPTRSFGAVDGQDFGQDFILDINGISCSIDVKSMHRQNNIFKANYVLNLPSYQVNKSVSLTDYYYCISFHENEDGVTVATFIGFVSKKDVINGNIGDLFKEGTRRIKEDNSSFVFMRDTYEVMFKDIASPLLNDRIKELAGFKMLKLLPGYRDNNIY